MGLVDAVIFSRKQIVDFLCGKQSPIVQDADIDKVISSHVSNFWGREINRGKTIKSGSAAVLLKLKKERTAPLFDMV